MSLVAMWDEPAGLINEWMEEWTNVVNIPARWRWGRNPLGPTVWAASQNQLLL